MHFWKLVPAVCHDTFLAFARVLFQFRSPYATEVARRMPAEKPLVTGSTYGASFPDFQKEAKAVADMSDDDFERAFREVDIDGSGALDKGELSLLLRHLLGREPTDLQVKALQ